MNNKDKTLTVADVEAALLMTNNIPVKNFTVNRLLELTTAHPIHTNKNIVMICSSSVQHLSFPSNPLRFPNCLDCILSTRVDTASASLNGALSAQGAYQLITDTINNYSQGRNKAFTLNQSDYGSFKEVMEEATKIIQQDNITKRFVYVQTDEPLIFRNGILTKEARPVARLVEKTASQGILTMVTATPESIPHRAKMFYRNLMPFLVLSPILSYENIKKVEPHPITPRRITHKKDYVVRTCIVRDYQIQNS